MGDGANAITKFQIVAAVEGEDSCAGLMFPETSNQRSEHCLTKTKPKLWSATSYEKYIRKVTPRNLSTIKRAINWDPFLTACKVRVSLYAL